MYKLSTFYKKGVKLYRPTEEEVKRRKKEYEKVRLEETIEKILKNAKKRADGKYDIYGDVNLYKMQLTSLLELPIKFGKISGDFFCSYNHLKDLKGAPEYVSDFFDCSDNQLRDLEGSPEYVGGSFYCSFNQLVSLEGAPKYVGGDFSCNNNQLESLEGAPGYVGGEFFCYGNQLISLEGAPKYVGKNFYIYNNRKKFTEEEVRKVVEVKGEVHI